MRALQFPFRIDPHRRTTLRTQIAHGIAELIREGKIGLGAPIPSSRELSHQLGVSRNTVAEAYDQLLSEGYLYTERAVGTFVARRLPEDALSVDSSVDPQRCAPLHHALNLPLPYTGRGAPGLHRAADAAIHVDFVIGRSDPRCFPQKVWRKITLDCLSSAPKRMSEYGDPSGLRELRQLITHFLATTRGMVVSTEQVLIVGGFQQGINLIAHMFVGVNAPVVVEAPCYRGACFLMESYGGRIIPVPVDQFGIDVARMPKAPAKLVYVTPSHQFPTGATMRIDRRLALLQWAAQAGAYIIEVDYDADFCYEGSPLPSLHALDRNNCVIYLNAFSRSIGPGLRLGYLVVPPNLIKAATTIKALIDNGMPWLEQAALTQFIRDGSFTQHLNKLRRVHQKKRDRLMSALRENFGEIEVGGAQGGTHLSWRMSENLPSAGQMQALARTVGVGLYALADTPTYFCEMLPDHDRTVLMGYAHLPEIEISEAIERVARAL